MSGERIRVGLVGCGNAGRNIHMRLLRQHADLYQVVCCADVAADAAKALAADFDIRAAASVEELLDDADVELVCLKVRRVEPSEQLISLLLREHVQRAAAQVERLSLPVGEDHATREDYLVDARLGQEVKLGALRCSLATKAVHDGLALPTCRRHDVSPGQKFLGLLILCG